MYQRQSYQDNPSKDNDSSHVRKIIHEFQLDVEEINDDRVIHLHENIIRKYSYNTKYRYAFAYHLLESAETNNEGGWELLLDFIKDNAVILFFEPNEYESIFLIKNGKNDLSVIFQESLINEFYLTNESFDYLAYYDDRYVPKLIITGKIIPYLLNSLDCSINELSKFNFYYELKEKQAPPPSTVEEFKEMYPEMFRNYGNIPPKMGC